MLCVAKYAHLPLGPASSGDRPLGDSSESWAAGCTEGQRLRRHMSSLRFWEARGPLKFWCSLFRGHKLTDYRSSARRCGGGYSPSIVRLQKLGSGGHWREQSHDREIEKQTNKRCLQRRPAFRPQSLPLPEVRLGSDAPKLKTGWGQKQKHPSRRSSPRGGILKFPCSTGRTSSCKQNPKGHLIQGHKAPRPTLV